MTDVLSLLDGAARILPKDVGISFVVTAGFMLGILLTVVGFVGTIVLGLRHERKHPARGTAA